MPPAFTPRLDLDDEGTKTKQPIVTRVILLRVLDGECNYAISVAGVTLPGYPPPRLLISLPAQHDVSYSFRLCVVQRSIRTMRPARELMLPVSSRPPAINRLTSRSVAFLAACTRQQAVLPRRPRLQRASRATASPNRSGCCRRCLPASQRDRQSQRVYPISAA